MARMSPHSLTQHPTLLQCPKKGNLHPKKGNGCLPNPTIPGRGGSERFNSEGPPQELVALSNAPCRTKTKKNNFLNTVFSRCNPLPSLPLMVAKSQEKSSAMADDIAPHNFFGQVIGSLVPPPLKIQNFNSIRTLHFSKTPATKTRAAFSETGECQPPKIALSRGVIQCIRTPHQILHQFLKNLTTPSQIFLRLKKKLKKTWFSSPSWVPKRVLKVSEIAEFCNPSPVF